MRNVVFGFLAVLMVLAMITIKASTLILALMGIGLYLIIEPVLPKTKEEKRQGRR